MSVGLPEIRVGDPLRHESLSVFPLFTDANSDVDYRLSDVALADESLLIEEVDQDGSVPDLACGKQRRRSGSLFGRRGIDWGQAESES